MLQQIIADNQQQFLNNNKEKWPRNTWLCVVEVRKQGAIGEFTPVLMLTLAEMDDIERYLLDDLASLGLEPRAILQKTKLA